MDVRAERAREIILNGFDEIGKKELTTESLCNLEKLVKSYHYLAEVEMLEDLNEEDDYERGYGKARGYRRNYRRRIYDGYGAENEDMKMFLEDSLRNARNEQERERIHRLMSRM